MKGKRVGTFYKEKALLGVISEYFTLNSKRNIAYMSGWRNENEDWRNEMLGPSGRRKLSTSMDNIDNSSTLNENTNWGKKNI